MPATRTRCVSAREGRAGLGLWGGARRTPSTLFLLGLASSYLQPCLSTFLPAASLRTAERTVAGPSPVTKHPPHVVLCLQPHHLTWPWPCPPPPTPLPGAKESQQRLQRAKGLKMSLVPPRRSLAGPSVPSLPPGGCKVHPQAAACPLGLATSPDVMPLPASDQGGQPLDREAAGEHRGQGAARRRHREHHCGPQQPGGGEPYGRP